MRNPIIENLGIDASFNRPISDTKALTVMFKNNVSARVSALLFCRRPLAVARLVVAVIVYAVYLQAFFIARLHIGYEIIHIEPTLADLYAATAITIISMVGWFRASADHHAPNIEKRISPRPMSGDRFSLEASAAFGLTSLQSVETNISRRGAAGTLRPDVCSFRIAMFSKNAKHSKATERVSNGNGFRSFLNHCCAPKMPILGVF